MDNYECLPFEGCEWFPDEAEIEQQYQRDLLENNLHPDELGRMVEKRFNEIFLEGLSK